MTRGRVRALDGIRGIAILAVLLGHGIGGSADDLAIFGVTLFFVLSGYLITGRLLSGQTVRRFYANRSRRLLPAMLFMLTITGAFFLNLGTSPWRLIEAGAYVRNISAAHFGNPPSPWVHMWSLATEEQFYLLWPLAFLLLGSRRQATVVVVGCASLVAMAIALVLGNEELARFSPLTQAWTLCLGCWLALRGWSPRWPAWLGWSLLRWFGVRSYGMYLWHFPLMVAASMTIPSDAAARWVGVVLGVGIATLSWRYVESPWLNAKKPPASPRRAKRGAVLSRG